MTDEIADMEAFCRDIAVANGLFLNPDDDRRLTVIQGLVRNLERYGVQYCPCRVPTGDEDVDLDIICPCSGIAADLEEMGHCRCNLFFRRDP